MSIRKMKRRAHRIAQFLVYKRKQWYSDDLLVWDRAPPVGREFGSPDYERFEREAHEQRQLRSQT